MKMKVEVDEKYEARGEEKREEAERAGGGKP